MDGFVVCDRPEDADVVVVNTCGFLRAAEEEALDTIGEAIRLKDQGAIRAVVVAGCLPSRYGTRAREMLTGVDAVVGVPQRNRIGKVCRTVLGSGFRGTMSALGRPAASCATDRDRLRITPRHFAYLRVAEGCNHTCAFCTIPEIRGRFRSKPMKELVREARELVSDGAVELNLIAQDTSEYGLDLYGRTKLAELVRRLGGIEGLSWIRLLYLYPTMVNDALIEEIAANPKVVKYVDLPIQHTRERVLRIMRRGVTAERQERLIDRIRECIPGVVLRTTVIAGHPGETIEDHEAMLADLERIRFERLGCFTFSPEPGTRAAERSDAVPLQERIRRTDAVMTLQQKIAFELNSALVGREVEAIIDARRSPRTWIGRTAGDAPDVDQAIRLTGQGGEGRIVRACVTRVHGYDVAGKILRRP
jgi:ribosomal protein S12 methylthiotransferase